MSSLASIPREPPYYAVIFASLRTEVDEAAYQAAADQMLAFATAQPGFLGADSARGADGLGITVSYWESEVAIRAWREHAEHQLAQAAGREKWYAQYELRVCRVERAQGFKAPGPGGQRAG